MLDDKCTSCAREGIAFALKGYMESSRGETMLTVRASPPTGSHGIQHVGRADRFGPLPDHPQAHSPQLLLGPGVSPDGVSRISQCRR